VHHERGWNGRELGRLVILLPHDVAVVDVGDGREEGDEGGHDGEPVREVRVAERRLREPVPVELEAEAEHDDEHGLDHRGADGDGGHGLDPVEGRATLAQSRLVCVPRTTPHAEVEDERDDLQDESHCDEDLDDDEPGRHNPTANGVQLRR